MKSAFFAFFAFFAFSAFRSTLSIRKNRGVGDDLAGPAEARLRALNGGATGSDLKHNQRRTLRRSVP
jgi:hypothetical protein